MKSRTTAALTTTLSLAACGSGGSDNQDNSMTDTENNCSNTANRSTLLRPALLASAISLAGCDPQFESTSDACSNLSGVTSFATLPRLLVPEENGTAPVNGVAAFNNDVDRDPLEDASGNQLYWIRATNSAGDLLFDDATGQQIFVPDYSAAASADPESFKLYFEDYLNALPETASIGTPDSDAQTLSENILDDILALLNDTFELRYTVENDQVVKSENALDFLASRDSTTDPDLIVGAFQTGRDRISQGIAADSGTCVYRNADISLLNDPFNSVLDVIYEMFYNPFAEWVQQSILTETPKGEDETITLSGFYFTSRESYVGQGYFEPSILRTAQSVYRDPAETQAESSVTMNLVDRYAGDSDELQQFSALSPEETDSLSDLQVISLTLSTQNGLCLSRDTDGDPIVDDNNLFVVEQCTEGTTRTPRRPECLREATQEELDDSLNFRDETGVNKEFWITLGGEDYKRVRVDIDFKQEEENSPLQTTVSVFGSTFFNAIENGNVLLDTSGNLIEETDSSGNALSDGSGNPIYVDRLTTGLEEVLDSSGNPQQVDDGRILYDYKGTQLLADVINDPSSCETTAVQQDIEERVIALDLSVDTVRRVADPAYDRELTINGEEQSFNPTPIYEYIGTLIPGRNIDVSGD